MPGPCTLRGLTIPLSASRLRRLRPSLGTIRSVSAAGSRSNNLRKTSAHSWPRVLICKRNRCKSGRAATNRSEEHTSELQSLTNLVCRLLLEKKKNTTDHQQQQHATYTTTS